MGIMSYLYSHTCSTVTAVFLKLKPYFIPEDDLTNIMCAFTHVCPSTVNQISSLSKSKPGSYFESVNFLISSAPVQHSLSDVSGHHWGCD